MTLSLVVDNLERLIALACLVAFSGMISASETALFALTRQQLARFRQSSRRSARTVLRLREDPRGLLSTVLLANIAVNILLYSMLAVTVQKLSGGSTAWTAGLGMAGFVIALVGAEIAPKLFALSAAEWLAPLVAEPVRVIKIATAFIRWTLERSFVEPLTRLVSGTADLKSAVGAEELQELVSIGRKEGLINDDENAMLHRVMELAAVRVSALMVPRVDVVAFNLAHDKNELVDLIRRHRLSRIPVFEETIDDIRGIIPAKEFLLNRDRPIREMIQNVHFVPEQASVEALLEQFRTRHLQLAFVVDVYGGFAGIVTLEDVAEAVVGEIHAPDKVPARPRATRMDARTYAIDGSVDAADFCHAFGLAAAESRAQTLGGMITEELGHLPAVGDTVSIGDIRVTVLSTQSHRVVQARLVANREIEPHPDLDRLLDQSGSGPVEKPGGGGE